MSEWTVWEGYVYVTPAQRVVLEGPEVDVSLDAWMIAIFDGGPCPRRLKITVEELEGDDGE